MTTHNTDHTYRTKLRRSALVSLCLQGMVIALRWLTQLGGGQKFFDHVRKKPSCSTERVFRVYEDPWIQNRQV